MNKVIAIHLLRRSILSAPRYSSLANCFLIFVNGRLLHSFVNNLLRVIAIQANISAVCSWKSVYALYRVMKKSQFNATKVFSCEFLSHLLSVDSFVKITFWKDQIVPFLRL